MCIIKKEENKSLAEIQQPTVIKSKKLHKIAGEKTT